MQNTAFQTSLPLRFSALPCPRTGTRITPSCGLSKELATAAAAAVTIGLSTLPVRPDLTDAFPEQQQHHHSLVVTTSRTHASQSNPLVVGVGKAAIHDYSPSESTNDTQPLLPTIVTSVEDSIDEDARREFSVAVRLVTAVLLGVMLGVERRATVLNLGVRSITLISLCSALTTLTLNSVESVPLLTAQHLTVVTAGLLAGVLVCGIARLRERRTRHITGMSLTIGLCVMMGGACGAGLSLLTVSCYLAAVAVMRGDSGRRRVAGVEARDFGVGEIRMPLDPVIMGRGKGDGNHGINGRGVSM